jgi:hypothetical protein
MRVLLPAPVPMPAPISASWASWETPEASYCGGAAGVVSGPFGRSSQGTASEICRLRLPAAGIGVALIKHLFNVVLEL